MLAIFICLAAIILLAGSYYAYRIAFYSPPKDREKPNNPKDPQYDPYRPEMKRIYHQLNNRPYERVSIRSKDGLKLDGRYYHVKDRAPLDIGFHGYRSNPVTDFSGGSELSFQMEHNLLLIEQRAHGKSEGNTISFGILERRDLLCWVDYAIERFGADVTIFLYGVSMGGATVLMASDLDLPKNVKAIIADFDALPIHEDMVKPRVGIVGEIMVKYHPVANNFVIDLVEAEGAEAVVPDLIDFFNYYIYKNDYKHQYLGSRWTASAIAHVGVKMIRVLKRPAIKALENSKRFEPMMEIDKLARYAEPFVSIGNQTGEGWFLTGEMIELIHSGVPNIVCTQPFGCLPNHVVGKGVIKELRRAFPKANIVAVDYDPGASEVNQLNRIKLMLSTANTNLKENN